MITIAQKKYLESKVQGILNGIIFGCIPHEAAQKLTETLNQSPILQATQHNNIVMIHDINRECILIVVFKYDGCTFKKAKLKSPVFYDALALCMIWIDENAPEDLDDLSSEEEESYEDNTSDDSDSD